MKKCNRCENEKDVSEFYKCSQAKDGLYTLCKTCCLKRDQDKRKNDPKFKQYQKLRNAEFHKKNREQISERKRIWFTSEKGKKSHFLSTAKYKSKNREKHLAHAAVERAIKSGKLIRHECCQFCNAKGRIEAHHSDYRKRLAVVWVCKLCHEIITRNF